MSSPSDGVDVSEGGDQLTEARPVPADQATRSRPRGEDLEEREMTGGQLEDLQLLPLGNKPAKDEVIILSFCLMSSVGSKQTLGLVRRKRLYGAGYAKMFQ